MMNNTDILIKGLSELNLILEKEKMEKFSVYKELLKEWNEKINITAITDDNEIDIKHFLDSLTIFKTGKVISGKKNNRYRYRWWLSWCTYKDC
jgi:16S rRNA (guanine527-N7)-methyltransferase